MGKSSEWVSGENRRYILSAEDVPELEREAGINEFVQKRPRDEAESVAYSTYRKKHLLQAAAHHLAMMKACSASGSYKEAKKHKLVYDMILGELGFNPHDSAVPDEVAEIMSDPDKNPGLRFQAHKGDAFLLNKSEEPIYVTPEWQLSPLEFDLPTLLAPPPLVKSDKPLAKSNPLQVSFLTNKLRGLRDWFDQQGITSINERDIPIEMRQQLMRVGRDYKGNFHRDQIQALIDQAQPREYGFDTGTYTSALGAAQRHSKEPSNVFKLNMTPQMEAQMKQAGVLDTYRRMSGLAQQAGHPGDDATLGWVRWTGDQTGVHVDEVQSDFGRPWDAFFADQFRRYVKRGDLHPSQVQRHIDEYARQYPEEQRKIIQKIGFGNKHPAEVLSEAFHEWARTHGNLSGAPVHIWQPEAKAYMATIDPFYEGNMGDMATFDYRRPIPGHLQTAYRDVPVKQGAVEGQYGEIPTQSTAKFKKQPPKSAVGKVGKVGGDIQWRPSTKTYKDTIRGKEKTVTKAEVAEGLLRLVKNVRANLQKGDVVPFPVDQAKAATVPENERTGTLKEMPRGGSSRKSGLSAELINGPHKHKQHRESGAWSGWDSMTSGGLFGNGTSGYKLEGANPDALIQMHNAFEQMDHPNLVAALRHYYDKPEDDVQVGNTKYKESHVARHVYNKKFGKQPMTPQPGDTNPSPTEKSELEKKGFLGAASNAGIKTSPEGGATPKAYAAASAPVGAIQNPSTPKGQTSLVQAEKKQYTGRDEGIRRSKLPPGAPGADKAGVGVQTDKKKEADKKAARKWKPSA